MSLISQTNFLFPLPYFSACLRKKFRPFLEKKARFVGYAKAAGKRSNCLERVRFDMISFK
jgi:hypothetical protein